MSSIALVAHNIRSTHNVGALLRTADGLGVNRVIFTGYTPYPHTSDDNRLPHIYKKIHSQIHKTALGAEDSINWQRQEDIKALISGLRQEGYHIVALEQAQNATALPRFKLPENMAVILGREVEGIEPDVIKLCDEIVEIPMSGQKESFNVVIAAAIFLSYCLFG